MLYVLSAVLVFRPFNIGKGNKNVTIGKHCYYKYQYFQQKNQQKILTMKMKELSFLGIAEYLEESSTYIHKP